MKEVSTVLLKNMDVKKYLDGATYMSLDDSISLQRKVSRDIKIPIIDATGNILYCKRNWIENIIYAQKCNKDGYGAQFPIVPKFGSSVCSTKILWILVSLLSSVKELWCILDNKKKKTTEWYGWMMVYVTKHCFSSIGIRTSRKCPFKFEHINTCPKILKKMDNLQLSFKNTEVFFDLFCNDKEIHVKEIYDLNFSAESINEISIIILINNEAKDNDTEYEDFSTDNLIISGITFELRYITLHTTINFNEVSYMRHGNEFMSWWKAERPHKLPIHSEFPKVQTNNIHFAVYVRLELPQVGEARDAFITYIGGQSHVFCS